MEITKEYVSPAIVREYAMELDAALLSASVVTPTTKVRTAGQDLDSHSFEDPGFNNSWE